jgi:hypothetical protein
VGPPPIYRPFSPTSTLSYRRPKPLFPDLSSTKGLGSLHLHSHIPHVTIHTQPQGRIFLTSHPGAHAHVQNYQIIVICSLSSNIVHVEYLVLMCAGTWSSQLVQPLQVYVRNWHVIIPSEFPLHLSITPSDIHL